MNRIPDPPQGSMPPPARQTTAYLKTLFKQVGFTIDAKRGQNFLVDLNLLDLLERSADVHGDDVVLEVGTGTGGLTERLARSAREVVSCEVDSRLAQLARDRLIDCDNLTLVEGDVLASKHRFAPAVLGALDAALSRGGRLLLVANLPYCVATPVISNLLVRPRPFDSATVTVQREMGERMTSAAGSHSYNALSVWIGAQCRSEIVRILPPSVFWPRPKVDSAIVRLELEPQRRAAIADLGRFHDFVRDVFCHRRKLLRGVLVRMASGRRESPAGGRSKESAVAGDSRVEKDSAKQIVDVVFDRMGFDADIRAEDIPPDEFVKLERLFAEGIARTSGDHPPTDSPTDSTV
jgi:16S rRNA (adenine1518-N6/adenine1519-N6)-dimethyltransferase